MRIQIQTKRIKKLFKRRHTPFPEVIVSVVVASIGVVWWFRS